MHVARTVYIEHNVSIIQMDVSTNVAYNTACFKLIAHIIKY